MKPILNHLNYVLNEPTEASIFDLFERDGFLRLNMLYISPIAIKHFRGKLQQYGLLNWNFTEDGLSFHLKDQVIRFKGVPKIIYNSKIFCIELDFDPIIPNNEAMEFLKDIETFLKKCDSCFFMSYFICIDTEILRYPLTRSIFYMANRK